MDDDRMITFPELKSEFGIPWCRQHIWREEKAGRFPSRRTLGNRRVVWRKGDIRDFVRGFWT
jgi:predicted DNA-binding transcriptional regulator AlpA